jgi:hypothetical protein
MFDMDFCIFGHSLGLLRLKAMRLSSSDGVLGDVLESLGHAQAKRSSALPHNGSTHARSRPHSSKLIHHRWKPYSYCFYPELKLKTIGMYLALKG